MLPERRCDTLRHRDEAPLPFLGVVNCPRQSECRTMICRRSTSTSPHSNATISPTRNAKLETFEHAGEIVQMPSSARVRRLRGVPAARSGRMRTSARMLRTELEQVDGFLDNIRYRSLRRDGVGLQKV